MREEILHKIAELILEDRIDLEEHPIEKIEYDKDYFKVTLGGVPDYHFEITMAHIIDNPEKEFALDKFYILFDLEEDQWK